jgi:hypothetical protein
MFILPNDKLSVYHDAPDRGIFEFRDDRIHNVEIVLNDAHNNKSTLEFKVKSILPSAQHIIYPSENNLIMMPYERSNRFRSENISVLIPAGSLYDTIDFSYKKDNGTPQMLSDVHYVHNRFTPVHKAYTLSIKPTRIPAGEESKLLIVQLSDDFIKSALSSTYNEGYVTAEALSFGMFFVGIDTIPPVIYANGLSSGADLTGRSEIRIKVTDELSGIKAYEPVIDGNWALFEYDQKNDVLIYRFNPKRIIKNTNHSLSLKVSDNKDNLSYFSCDFAW